MNEEQFKNIIQKFFSYLDENDYSFYESNFNENVEGIIELDTDWETDILFNRNFIQYMLDEGMKYIYITTETIDDTGYAITTIKFIFDKEGDKNE